MTDVLIQKQIEAIKATGSKARATKATALQFLVDAGLLTKKLKGTKKVAPVTIKRK